MPEAIILSGADADLQRAFARFEDRRAGLGDRFLAAVERVRDPLRAFPESAPVRLPPLRRALISGFTFGLYFAIERRGLVVHAVLDLRQSPEWIERVLRERLGE